MRDSLHHAAVAQEDIGKMIDDLVVRAIERTRQSLLGQRHANGVRQPLTKRASSRLDTNLDVSLGVPGGTLPELAKLLQLVDAQRIAAKISDGIEQHRAVAVRQNEPVPVIPARVARVVT